ncbi:DUF2809 domain-containing protein [Clavibacter nebraskensis]|uniref:ribosomal maturation YjgA family protein n=1 Tax=Clavibacter nebraskensis TaxID=31963 RepID=UPI003D068FDC
MRHSGDVDAFVWDEPSMQPADGPADAAPVVDRDVRLPDGNARRRIVSLGALIAVMPRVDTVVHGAAVLVWCTGIELLQITGWPEMWALHVPLCRLLLGTGYDPVDLAAYAAGVLLVLLVDRLLQVGRGIEVS